MTDVGSERIAGVREADPIARFVLRGGPEAVASAAASLGFPLPDRPCRSTQSGGRAALWLGPDEWLLLLPVGARDETASNLARALTGIPHALVDVGARNRGLVLAGPQVEDVLAAGCPLDLDVAAFGVGMCARTLFGKSEIVLWRTAPAEFRIEVARSYAPYVIDLLAQAVRDAACAARA